jgi:hypothetical protein
MMDANEQKVRAVWDVGRVTRMADICADESWHRFDSWADAAEFTESRLEEVRQLREEIKLVQFLTNGEGYGQHGDPEEIVADVRGIHAFARVLSRLEATLADLTHGMKPEAL